MNWCGGGPLSLQGRPRRQIQHSIKHITEEMNLDQLHDQMHQQQVGVTEADICGYANRQQFWGSDPGPGARPDFGGDLGSGARRRLRADYINRLKEGRHDRRPRFCLMAVPEPTGRNSKTITKANLDQYLLPAQAVVDGFSFGQGVKMSGGAGQGSRPLTHGCQAGEGFARWPPTCLERSRNRTRLFKVSATRPRLQPGY